MMSFVKLFKYSVLTNFLNKKCLNTIVKVKQNKVFQENIDQLLSISLLENKSITATDHKRQKSILNSNLKVSENEKYETALEKYFGISSFRP